MHARLIALSLTLALVSGNLGCGNSATLSIDDSVAVIPEEVSVQTGGTIAFSATVTGTSADQSTAVTWSVEEALGGTVSTSGYYTAPATAGTYHVIATSVAYPSRKRRATVTVTPLVIAVSISPKTASTPSGSTVSFTATVSGTSSGQSTAVTWSVQEAAGGTVDSSGRYTAPATAGTYHVSATSVADPSARDTASVTVGATGTPAALYGAASSTCAAMPVRTTGVTHYFCDCAAGAQAGCVAGSDSNDGLTPSTPKQLLSTAVSTFNAMNGGDTVALCKGGGWSDSAGLRFNNPRCSGSASMRTAANTTTCDLRDYAPPWGGTAKPILRETGTGINLLQFWNTAGTSGVRILNLDLEGGGTGPGGTDVGTRAIASDSNNSNFLICNNTINGWNHGVHI